MGEIINLANLGVVDRTGVKVIGLIDGSRIICQECADDNGVGALEPYRLLTRPVGDDAISIEMIDFVVGAGASPKLTLNPTAIAFRYVPDDKLLSGYADHVAKARRISNKR